MPRYARQAPKRKSKISINSDSASGESETEDKQQKCDQPCHSPRRHSSRLYSKRNKPDFKLPTRDAIWKDIPTIKSPEKLSRLTPRKSVNNFTKVYNTYNFDDYEDTGDEETASDSSSSFNSDEQTPRRVKNYHKRIRVVSSSSDESDNQALSDAENPKKDTSDFTKVANRPEKSSALSGAKEAECKVSKIPTITPQLAATICNFSGGIENDAVSQADQDDPPLEDTHNINNNSDDSEENVSPSKKLNRSLRRSILDSSDDTDSENDDSTSCTDRTHTTAHRPQRSENLKQKQKSLFSNFKDAISKRKSRLGSLDFK